MKAKEFNKLIKSNDPSEIISDYMTCKIYLTERQLQKVIDKKQGAAIGHGGCAFGKRKCIEYGKNI